MLWKLQGEGRPWTLARVYRGVARYGPAALLDAVLVLVALAVGLILRFGPDVPARYWTHYPAVGALLAPLYIVTFLFSGIYFLDEYSAGFRDAIALIRAAGVATLIALSADFLLDRSEHPVPLGTILVTGVLVLLGSALIRSRRRLVHSVLSARAKYAGERVLIVGAGQAGRWLARTLQDQPADGYVPVGFVDDDPGKLGARINGLRVLGTRHDIAALAQRLNVEVVALAIPSLCAEERRRILACCEEAPVRIKILPGVTELLGSGGRSAGLRDARIEDMLGRPSVVFEDSERRGAVLRETVLITGAAGSIGSELARQVRRAGPRRLVLLDNNETGLFDLAAELALISPLRESSIEVVLASTTDAKKIDRIFAECRPQAVFHAAAYKHVPLMEENADEAVKINVGGTLNVCRAADATGVERLVFISTDKAVDASNTMGASKRVGERIVQAFDGSSSTVFCSVRFGNVLGSRGSVIPIFERQIKRGGPLTVTHPEATRYFMTIPEAANLIIEAACFARGGETFILDMGTSVRIDDLARRIIRLHGLRPEVDIEIKYSGLRPGEKLHEALTLANEELVPTAHPQVARVHAAGGSASRAEIIGAVRSLVDLADSGELDAMRAELNLLVRDASGMPATGAIQ